MTTDGALGGFDTGRVVARAADLLRRKPGAFLLLSLLLVGVPGAVLGYLTEVVGLRNTPTSLDPNTWGFWGASTVVALFGGILMKGAIVHGALADLNGGSASFGESLASSFGDSLVLLSLGVVTALGITAGMFLLVIPGVMLAMAWSVVIPVRVSERLGIWESITRSRELTRDRRGEIFGLAATYTIAQGLVSWLASIVVSAVGNPVFGFLVQPALETVVGVIGAVGIASIYCELRWSKEGAPIDSLAAVFD